MLPMRDIPFSCALKQKKKIFCPKNNPAVRQTAVTVVNTLLAVLKLVVFYTARNNSVLSQFLTISLYRAEGAWKDEAIQPAMDGMDLTSGLTGVKSSPKLGEFLKID